MTKARIKSVPKIAPRLSERAVRPEETFARAKSIAARKGVTRLADITGLDRLGIPVYSAIVPKSDDKITVYNGKGVLPIEARTGALMESIERQTVIYTDIEIVEGTYRELRGRNSPAIDPRLFNQKLRGSYADDQPYWWVRGYDLICEETVLVPAILAAFGPRFAGTRSPFAVYSTNGLASGNCLEEAVCHALCELVERDAWTLAELRSQWMPRAKREALLGPEAGANGIDDCDAYPRVDLTRAGWPIDELMWKFERAGLCPVVRDITSDFGIACAMASAVDERAPDFPQAHSGLGAHPNSRIAIIRALTEMAQSRAVDIQGVREDILPAHAIPSDDGRHLQRVQRIDYDRWMLRNEGITRSFADMVSTVNDDIRADIGWILNALVDRGIERAIVVDLSEPDGFSIVRAIVPGLEFWVMDRGKLGQRATRFWNQHTAPV